MRVTGSMVVVEHTFFLTMSRAMADLCQYTRVSFTMMKEIAEKKLFRLRVGVFRQNIARNQ